MTTKLLALALLAGGSMFAQTRFSIGIGVGGYQPGYVPAPVYVPAPAYAVVEPPYPGPGYYWVDGYWSPNRWRSVWIPGYWTRQVYRGGYYPGAYGRQIYARGFYQSRGYYGGGNRGRGYGQSYGRGNGRAIGFRGR